MALRDCIQKHSNLVIYCFLYIKRVKTAPRALNCDEVFRMALAALCSGIGSPSSHRAQERSPSPSTGSQPTFRTCSRFSSLARGWCFSSTPDRALWSPRRACGWAGHTPPSPRGRSKGEAEVVATRLGPRAGTVPGWRLLLPLQEQGHKLPVRESPPPHSPSGTSPGTTPAGRGHI